MERCSSVLLLVSCLIHGGLAKMRLHHIAAVEIEWVYSKRGRQSSLAETETFQKVVFKEFHDSRFTREKAGPEWRGLLGPTLRAEVGDTLKIHFKNKASYPFNIHLQGIPGRVSVDGFIHGNSLYFESKDERVMPFQKHTYKWKITEEVGPTSFDPQCLTYTYSSHVDIVKDRHAGLIGALLICKPGSLDDTGKQIKFDAEFVLLFSVFDESQSWYYENEKKTPVKMYSINGFTNGTLPELDAKVCGKISWHLIGMSHGPEMFSVHFNGQVLLQNNHKVSSIGLVPDLSVTAEMFPIEVGKWLLSSQVQHHRQAELYGYLNIEKEDVKESALGYHSGRRAGKLREHFIAAEEMDWNYAPHIPNYIDRDFKSKYLEKGANRIGKIYKKAKYVEYTDGTFSNRKTSDEDKSVSILQNGIEAPVIRGEIRDIIKIYFKNMASRPYSIYPHGISVNKQNEGVNYPGNSSDAKNQVEPGEIHVYLWIISEKDGPTSSDPRCLTRMYHSAVDITRDIASGLFGSLIICKGHSLDARNLQIRVDQEQRIIFSAIDENQSWYINENIQLCLDPSSVDPTDPEFYESNIMYTINGFVYESIEALPFCEGDAIYWHIFSIGSQDSILSIHFHGHTFSHRKTNEDVIHLFPLSGETLTMQMDNLGEWLLRSLSTQQRTYGMRMRIKVYLCDDEAVSYPLFFIKIEYEGEKLLVEPTEEESSEEIDAETLELLKELNLRSFKNTEEMIEEEDILQFIEDETTESNTSMYEDQNSFNDTHWYSNRNQSKTSINTINSPNTDAIYDVYYYTDEEDNFEEPTKLNENSTVQPTKDEAQIAEASLSHSQPLNLTLINTHLNHNMHGMLEKVISSEISIKNYNARNDSIVLQDNAPRTTANNTTFLMNVNDTDALTIHKRSLTDIPASTVPQSTHFQITAENINDVNITDGKGQEEYHTVPRGSGSEIKSQEGDVEDLIKKDCKDVEINAGSETGCKQETNQQKGDVVKTDGTEELGLIGESPLLVNSQAIPPEHIQRGENKTTTNIGNASEATIESEKNNLFSEASSEAQENFTSTSNESSMESSKDPEKVFIFLKKHLKGKHRVRFQGTPLKLKEHHLTYEVEDKGISVSTIKSLKWYIKDRAKNNPRKQLKTAESARRQAAAEMMLKQRNRMKSQMSPRGFKPGIKQRTNVLVNKHNKSTRGVKPKHKHSVIYQDDVSNTIIVGIPKRDNGVTLEYDEYVAEVEVKPFRAALEKDEEKTDLDSVSPYIHDSRTHSDMSRDPEMIVEHYLRSHSGNVRRYFIAAEEIYWDYSRNTIDFERSAKQRNSRYKKVVFRRYTDAFFRDRYDLGERDVHLGILGPLIRAEVNDVIKVMFKNLASRPYSIHAHGLLYEKSSEGMSYEDFSTDWFKSDDVVLPNTTYTYVWNVPPRSGPKATEVNCKPWVYYSSVDFEKDINSGLIGPLLICRNGTLMSMNDIPKDVREFVLLFNTFDETKSWYFNENKKQICDQDCGMSDNSDFIQQNTFHAINGFVNGSLRGLVMFEKEIIHFYLINMGTSGETHSIYLDGHAFTERGENVHRLGSYSLYPGAFRTVEMVSSTAGIWLLDCENGEHYKAGMKAYLLILSKDCDHPLGMASGIISDSQITASDYIGQWEPKLARLHNNKMVNAWSAEMHNNKLLWIQATDQQTKDRCPFKIKPLHSNKETYSLESIINLVQKSQSLKLITSGSLTSK
ncbi:coagulation factor V isoform X2 [Narcine bancroftii]|uniref:coagulation factor V isoform X2 n=1 Tax=Narcine bancroftii TaxID=1343680 RepID=UPI0038320A7C